MTMAGGWSIMIGGGLVDFGVGGASEFEACLRISKAFLTGTPYWSSSGGRSSVMFLSAVLGLFLLLVDTFAVIISPISKNICRDGSRSNGLG